MRHSLRVKAGFKVEKPIQACVFISESGVSQNLHNIIVVEDGAQANIITGCNIRPGVAEGLQVDVGDSIPGSSAPAFDRSPWSQLVWR